MTSINERAAELLTRFPVTAQEAERLPRQQLEAMLQEAHAILTLAAASGDAPAEAPVPEEESAAEEEQEEEAEAEEPLTGREVYEAEAAKEAEAPAKRRGR